MFFLVSLLYFTLDEILKNNTKIGIFCFTLKDFINLTLNLVFICSTLVQSYIHNTNNTNIDISLYFNGFSANLVYF
jgi:hypothetical protein